MPPHSRGDGEGSTVPSRRTRVATVYHFRRGPGEMEGGSWTHHSGLNADDGGCGNRSRYQAINKTPFNIIFQ